MSVEPSKIKSLLNDLSLSLTMASPEDLVALGEILVKLETIIEVFSNLANETTDQILDGSKKAIEAVILEQVENKARGLEILGDGISLLQEIERNISSGSGAAPDISDFLNSLQSDINIDLTDSGGAIVETVLAEEPGPIQTEIIGADEDNELFFSFITEGIEHLETIEVSILELEEDPGNLKIVDSIFRPFHTIKGCSGFLNLTDINSLAHNVENLLDDARNETIGITPALIDLVLDAVDLLKKMISETGASISNGEKPQTDLDLSYFFERIKAIQQGDMPEEDTDSEYGGLKLGEILIDRGVISDEELDAILEAQEISKLTRLGERLIEKNIISSAELDEALKLQLENSDKKLGEILVDTGKIDHQTLTATLEDQEAKRNQKLGEVLIKEKQAAPKDVAIALREQKKTACKTLTTAKQTVKIDTLKLDALVDMVGELVIAQSLVSSSQYIQDATEQKLIRDLSQLGRITSDLQKTAMSMRMVPIKQTFKKMIRLIRDLSKKSGKQVELIMSGEETEIDRNVVEAIYDPLVHMIRNSVDHGIEIPDKRRSSGKSPEGRVHLKAYHQGGNVVIEIIDDGQGLDRDKIIAKAMQRGLVRSGDNLNDAEIYNLIFQPGFSTAEKITDVSGRGVGMDVVKKAIEKLRGKVEVQSELGKGSTITIRLPLTLAIIDGMIVRLGQDRYVLPTIAIQEAFQVTPNDYHTIKGRGEMVKVRGELLPLIRLYEIFGNTPSRTEAKGSLIVVLEDNGKRKCLMIDEVLGKQEVVIKSLGEGIRTPKAVAGGTILGDGRVGLILDVAGIFKSANGVGAAGINFSSHPSEDDLEMEDDWGM